MTSLITSQIVGAKTASRIVGAGRFALGGAGVIGLLVSLVSVGKLIADQINKGNDNASDFYKGQGGNNFQPFIGSGALD